MGHAVCGEVCESGLKERGRVAKLLKHKLGESSEIEQLCFQSKLLADGL